jgi:ribosomal protein S18 acetylase RimI-like enzyme
MTDDKGQLRGTAAFMLSPSFRAARRARVAVLHALGPQSACTYRPLVEAARAALAGQADDCYLFLPEELGATREALEGLGFRFERTAYLMSAPTLSALSIAKAKADLPAGYGLRALEKPGQGYPDGLLDFVAVRNRNFRELQGSVDTRPEDLLDFMGSEEYLAGGLILALAPTGEPCGTLRVERDDEEGSGFIGTISVDKEHRGRGLARGFVRIALALCREAGFREAFLSVNAENRGALSLYESEGFSVVKAMSCLALRLDGDAAIGGPVAVGAIGSGHPGGAAGPAARPR